MTLVRTQPFFFVLQWSFPHCEVHSEICALLDTPLNSVRFLHNDEGRDRLRGNLARALAWRRRSQGVKTPPSPTTGWLAHDGESRSRFLFYVFYFPFFVFIKSVENPTCPVNPIPRQLVHLQPQLGESVSNPQCDPFLGLPVGTESAA